MRKAHMLRENATSERWQDLIFLDTETTATVRKHGVTDHTFRLAWARYHRVGRKTDEYASFDKPGDLWTWITERCKPKRKVVAFAHHLYFDLKVSLGHLWLPQHGWKAWRYYFAENGPTCFVCLKKDNLSLWLIDSLNFFQIPLEKAAPLVGRVKPVVDFSTASDAEVSLRCREDVDILGDLMLQYLGMIASQDLGNPAKTLAGQAFNLYRHKYLRYPIALHDTEKAYRLELAGYKGARTECFKVGTFTGDFYMLDVHSHYPSVMQRYSYPTKLLRYQEHGLSIPYLSYLKQRYFLIADVTITACDSYYPFTTAGNRPLHYAEGDVDPLSMVDVYGTRTAFPRGTFRTVLVGRTLQRAIEQGAIQTLHRLAIYEQRPIFSAYVADLWRLRKQAQDASNPVYAQVWKRLLNSLYGKFGQRVRQKQSDFPCDPSEFSIGTVHDNEETLVEWRCFGLATRFSQQRACGRESFIGISAGVADDGRNALWALMMEAGEEHVYYCDTDAVIVDATGYKNLEHRLGSGLGQLDCKLQAPRLTIRAPKDYDMGSTSVRKGIRPSAIYDPKTGKFRQERWEHIRGGLRDQNATTYTVREEARRGAMDVWGRHVLPDGSTVPAWLGGRDDPNG